MIEDEADRSRLAELWPMVSIPVMVDDRAGITLPESTAIVDYLDGLGEAPPLIPDDPVAALQARLWDRVIDGYLMTRCRRSSPTVCGPTAAATPRASWRHGRRWRRRTSCWTGTWRARLGRGTGVHRLRLRCRSGAVLRAHRAALGRAADGQPDALLHRADGAPVRRSGDRRGARVSAPLPVAVARVRAVAGVA